MNKYLFLFSITIVLVSCVNIIKTSEKGEPFAGEQVVTFIVNNVPKNHNFNDDIYISGDFEGWSGGKESFKLKKQNRLYFIDVPMYKETISYKFTKGKWGTEECNINGNPVANRTYTFHKLRDTVFINIKNWSTGNIENKPSTAAKNVQVFAEEFPIPQLQRTRKISVYLPPNYDTSTKTFPVLYMLDGQNIFDVSRSYSGEWEVDETLNKLYNEIGFDLIVVAIDHGNEHRINEYSAWDNEKYGNGEGDAFLNFIISNLKPEIDTTFRTKKAAEFTAIMGSSMGGLFAHFAALKYPEIFGKAGVFSPSFWYAKEVFGFTEINGKLPHSRLYYLVGEKEGLTMVKPMMDVVTKLLKNGHPKENIHNIIAPNGVHSESFWKTEFERAIRWLFVTKK